jgi:hypothetical protein
LFRAAQLRIRWQLCNFFFADIYKQTCSEISPNKELDVDRIEFFLFAGQRYFIFSEKPACRIFPLKKNVLTPLYIGVIFRLKQCSYKSWLFSCSLKGVGTLTHLLTDMKFHSYRIKMYKILILNDLDTVSPAVFFSFPLCAIVNRWM